MVHGYAPFGFDDMKILLAWLSVAAFAIALGLTSTSSRAEPVYAWCAVSSSGGLGQPLCHFATLEQCNAFLMGLNGSCRPNPRATAVGASPSKRHKS
jgi:Protein of unknown function (DUF3551)